MDIQAIQHQLVTSMQLELNEAHTANRKLREATLEYLQVITELCDELVAKNAKLKDQSR